MRRRRYGERRACAVAQRPIAVLHGTAAIAVACGGDDTVSSVFGDASTDATTGDDSSSNNDGPVFNNDGGPTFEGGKDGSKDASVDASDG